MKYNRYAYTISFGEKSSNQLSRFLLENSFSDHAGSGYQIHKNNKQISEGRFIRKLDFVEELETPSGEHVSIPRIIYETTQFLFNKENKFLYLINPARKLDTLWGSLSKFSPNNFYFSRIKIDPNSLIRYIEDQGSLVHIRSIHAYPEKVDESTTITSTYVSGCDLRSYFNGMSMPKIRRIQASVSINNKLHQLEFSETGRISSNSLPGMGVEDMLSSYFSKSN